MADTFCASLFVKLYYPPPRFHCVAPHPGIDDQSLGLYVHLILVPNLTE